MIFGVEAGKVGERFKFSLTLGLASLVEVLGFLLAILHVMNHMPIDRRPFPQRLAQFLGKIGNLKNLRTNADRYGEIDQEELEDDVEKRSKQKSIVAPPKPVAEADDLSGPTLEQEWVRCIAAQAKLENRKERDLVAELLPVTPEGLSSAKGVAAFFSAKPFIEKGVLAYTAVATGVARLDEQGWQPGKNWTKWQKFLMRKLTLLHRLPKSKQRGLLRAVGG